MEALGAQRAGDVVKKNEQPSERSSTGDRPEVMTIAEAAVFLRVNHKTLREAVNRGDVPGAVRVGRVWRLSRSALVSWLQGSASPALGETR